MPPPAEIPGCQGIWLGGGRREEEVAIGCSETMGEERETHEEEEKSRCHFLLPFFSLRDEVSL